MAGLGRGRARRLCCMPRLGVLRQERCVHGPCPCDRGGRSVPWFEPFSGPLPDQPEPWSSSRERRPWTSLGPRTADGVVRPRALLLGGRVVPATARRRRTPHASRGARIARDLRNRLGRRPSRHRGGRRRRPPSRQAADRRRCRGLPGPDAAAGRARRQPRRSDPDRDRNLPRSAGGLPASVRPTRLCDQSDGGGSLPRPACRVPEEVRPPGCRRSGEHLADRRRTSPAAARRFRPGQGDRCPGQGPAGRGLGPHPRPQPAPFPPARVLPGDP